MAFLELTGIHKAFGASVAVERVDLAVERGEFISLLGPSGCGKTTTLRMIAGFELPTGGTIAIDGSDVSRRPPRERSIGMVFQSYALFPNMTVAANIGFGLKLAGVPAAEIAARVDQQLALINMATFSRRYPAQLSGGQQQRVALARALAIRPKLLLLDEPLSALDATIRVSLRAEIKAIQRELGITTIYVTHDQEEALALSDRIVVMRAGQVEQIGTPFEIYNRPRTPAVAAFIGTLNLLQADMVDAATGAALIENQPVRLPAALARAGKSVVSVALRPETLTFDRTSDAVNRLEGVIEDVAFRGTLIRFRVRVGRQTLHVDALNNPGLILPVVGQPVQVAFAPDSCVLHGAA
jgi:putative spermidine/putrescine transport system ATP-binding protein